MSADRVAEIFRQLKEPHCSELLTLLDADTRVNIRRLLEYSKDSAGSMMTTEFASVPSTYTRPADARLPSSCSEQPRNRLHDLRAGSAQQEACQDDHAAPAYHGRSANAGALGSASRPSDHRRSPREDVARLISKYDLLAVPVVDHGRVIGIVAVDDVIDAMVQKSTEEAQKFGGMAAIHDSYMEVGFWQMMKKRGGWLCALFLSEMLTASAMQGYEGELEKAIVLTLFIPLDHELGR